MRILKFLGIQPINCIIFNFLKSFLKWIIPEKESGARGVFQSICLQIRDPKREIDLNQIDWISSCSLPNSCLPGALFRMTNGKSSRGIIFESCMETQFPITSLLIAVGSGLDLTLNDFVLDDHLSFGNALSIALAQEPFLKSLGRVSVSIVENQRNHADFFLSRLRYFWTI